MHARSLESTKDAEELLEAVHVSEFLFPVEFSRAKKLMLEGSA